MNKCDMTYLLLCYNRFSPLIIEITCLILCLIGGILTHFGLLGIPFHIDSNIYKFFFFINIPYFTIIAILNGIFLVFRCLNLINNTLNLWGYGLSIIEIYLALFGLITSLINDSLIITNIRNYDILSKRNSEKYPMITPDEELNTKIILPIILFIWFNFLLMALTDNLLINLKINGSYHNYELAIEENRKFIESQNHRGENNQDNQTYQSNHSSQNSQDNGGVNIQVMNNMNINNNDINTNNKMNYNLNNNIVSHNNSIISNILKGSAVVLITEDNNQNINLKNCEEQKN